MAEPDATPAEKPAEPAEKPAEPNGETPAVVGDLSLETAAIPGLLDIFRFKLCHTYIQYINDVQV